MAENGDENACHRLVQILQSMIDLLERNGEAHWQLWMATVLRQIVARDISGIERLLDAYGGMGSFNDLWLCDRNDGHPAAEIERDNQRLQSLGSEAWGLATALKRAYDRPQ